MIKNKVVVVAILGALAVSLGLCACAGGSNSGGASSAASSAASGSSSAASSAASASASSSAASSSASTTLSDYWAGKLEDGSTVDYFDDAQDMKPGLVILSADGAQGKAWVGSIEVGASGKPLTITDDTTKETVTINPDDNPASGTMQWEIEGYGKVTLEKASDGSAYQEHLAQVGELA